MDEQTERLLERALDRRADSVSMAVEMLRLHILDRLAIEGIPATATARDIIRIRNESKRDADVVLALLAYPALSQPEIVQCTEICNLDDCSELEARRDE